MMGPSHALSGAAAWLAGSWALDNFAGYHQSPLAIGLGATVCAGGALLPDLDLSGRVTTNQGGATVAHTFGVFSLFVAEVIEKVSLGIYSATRMRHDPHRRNGHRTFAHFGKWAVVGIIFVMAGMALRGLFDKWAERAGWLIVTLCAAAIAVFTAARLPGDRGYPLLGFAVGFGCVVHLLGDIITTAGVPILWPIPTGRRMWRMIGVPNGIAVKVGGKTETIVLRTAFTLVALLAIAALFAPQLLHRFEFDAFADRGR
jgi:hypothetical protein